MKEKEHDLTDGLDLGLTGEDIPVQPGAGITARPDLRIEWADQQPLAVVRVCG